VANVVAKSLQSILLCMVLAWLAFPQQSLINIGEAVAASPKKPVYRPKVTKQKTVKPSQKPKAGKIGKSTKVKAASSSGKKAKAQKQTVRKKKVPIKSSMQKKFDKLDAKVQKQFRFAVAGKLQPKGKARGDIVPGHLLKDGRVSLTALESAIPRNSRNLFKPNANLKLGFKYEWTNPKSGSRYKLWGHEANPIARKNWPSSLSARHWTVRISRTNGNQTKFLTTNGKWVKDKEANKSITHIPIR